MKIERWLKGVNTFDSKIHETLTRHESFFLQRTLLWYKADTHCVFCRHSGDLWMLSLQQEAVMVQVSHHYCALITLSDMQRCWTWTPFWTSAFWNSWNRSTADTWRSCFLRRRDAKNGEGLKIKVLLQNVTLKPLVG